MAISDAIIIPITVPAGDSESAGYFAGTARLTGLWVPTLESTKISFKGAAEDGDTYYEIVDETLGKLEVNAGTGEYLVNLVQTVEGPAWVKIVLGTTQGADRTFKLILKAN